MLLVFASTHGYLTITVGPRLRSSSHIRASGKTVKGVKKGVIMSTYPPKPWNLRFIDFKSILKCHRLLSSHFTNPEGIWNLEKLVTAPDDTIVSRAKIPHISTLGLVSLPHIIS